MCLLGKNKIICYKNSKDWILKTPAQYPSIPIYIKSKKKNYLQIYKLNEAPPRRRGGGDLSARIGNIAYMHEIIRRSLLKKEGMSS